MVGLIFQVRYIYTIHTNQVMRLLKTIRDIIGVVIILIPALLLLVLCLPFILLALSFSRRNEERFNIEYHNFLVGLNGATFFWYSDKRTTLYFIEDMLLPGLKPEIEIIKLQGKKLITAHDHRYISRLIANAKTEGGIPYIIKIVNGTVISKSINNEVYNAINGRMRGQELLALIDEFVG